MIEINTPEQLFQLGDLATPPAIAMDRFTVTIRSLRAQNSGENVCICVDLTDTFRNLTEVRRYNILTELLTKLDVHRGVIPREKLDEIERAAQLSAAYTRSLSILAYGANSAHALSLKLRRRGFDPELSEEAVTMLLEKGYLKEEDDAHREVQRCISKGWGRRRIESYLRQRGYDSTVTRAALDELWDMDDAMRCAEVAARKSPTPPTDEKQKQKLIAYLLRQGYDMSDIRHALASAWEQE